MIGQTNAFPTFLDIFHRGAHPLARWIQLGHLDTLVFKILHVAGQSPPKMIWKDVVLRWQFIDEYFNFGVLAASNLPTAVEDLTKLIDNELNVFVFFVVG